MPKHVKKPTTMLFAFTQIEQKALESLSKYLGQKAHKDNVRSAFMNYENLSKRYAQLKLDYDTLTDKVEALASAYNERERAESDIKKILSNLVK